MGNDYPVRIGTWNLDAKGSPDHLRLIEDLACDIWLLTEVPAYLSLVDGALTVAPARMSRGQRFAAVWSRIGGRALVAPNPASAAMAVGTVGFYASVLPWRASGPDWPSCDGDQASRTVDAIHALERAFGDDVVWGGDWNQTMTGPNLGGTKIGRTAIEKLLERRGLQLATRELPHRAPGMAAIDHISVPHTWTIKRAERHPVPSRLSDHDAYVIEVQAVDLR